MGRLSGCDPPARGRWMRLPPALAFGLGGAGATAASEGRRTCSASYLDGWFVRAGSCRSRPRTLSRSDPPRWVVRGADNARGEPDRGVVH